MYGGPHQNSEPEVSVSDEDGCECVAPESDKEVVDETLYQSPMKNHAMSKSRKVIVPEPLIPSDSEDKEHRSSASPAPLRAGGKAKYVRRGSNQFPVMYSKAFAARKAKAGGRGRK